MEIERIKEIIQERLGVEVEESTVSKNGVIKQCLIIGDGNARPTLYAETIDKVTDENVDNFIESVKEAIKEGEKKMEELKNFEDFEWVKDKLRLCVGPMADDDAVRRPFLDISQYVRVIASDYSACVKKSAVELWGITEDELFEIAKSNTHYKVTALSAMIGALVGDDVQDREEAPYIISTSNMLYGGSCICNMDELGKVADKLEEDVYIIPSSIHEILVFPQSMWVDSMKGMVAEVNANVVDETDVLSNSVYIYSRENRELRIA